MSIIKDIAIPEISRYLKKRYEETGQIPTEEELKEELMKNTSLGIAIGQAWLDAHK